MGVGPHRLGADGRTGGIGLVHLADEHERARGDAVLRQVGRDLGEAVHAVTHVDGPGAGRGLVAPRDRARQRPVDLERGRVVLEPLEVGHQLRRQVLLAHEVAVQRGSTDVGQHPAWRTDGLAVGQHDGDRAAAAHVDADDRRVAAHDAAPRREPVDQRAGELARAALGHREAELRPEPGEHPAEEATGRHVGPEVGVHGVAGEQHRRAFARELLLAHARHRRARGPRELEQAGTGPA